MSHKTLIGGTAYEITGGKSMVNNTVYDVKGGRTLVGGTGYDISFIAPAQIKEVFGANFITSFIKYVNGYWIIGGRVKYTFIGDYKLYYTQNLSGTWSCNELSAQSGLNWEAFDIAYGNGYWVLSARTSIDDNEYASAFYSTSLSGTFTQVDLWSGYYLQAAKSIIYANGYFVIGGAEITSARAYSCIAYTTNPSGSWTTKDIWTSSSVAGEIFKVTYANGYWVAVGSASTSSSKIGRLAYSTSLSGNWTIKDVWTFEASHIDAEIRDITYANGYWAVCGWGRTVGSSSIAWDGFSRIAYSTSLNGEWTIKDIWSCKDSVYSEGASDAYQALNRITYGEGYWVVGGVNRSGQINYQNIAYATNLNGPWTIKTLFSNAYLYWDMDSIKHVSFDNGYLVVGAYCMKQDTADATTTYSTKLFYGEGIENFEKL